MGGAFQVSRDIFTNPIWQDIPKFRIFFYIVGNAVFSNEGVRIGNVKINRGQFLRSYRNISDDLQYLENRKVKKYSVSVISRKIDQLVKEERLKIEDTELGTLFTVINYDEYQTLDNYKKQLGTELEQCWNNEGTVLEQKRNNNKNVKKDKNVNIYAEVINHLNEKAGTNFKHTTKKTRELINGRLNDKFTKEDLILVIDYCCKHWKGKIFSNGNKGDDYLQPSTLFNGKFDERLQLALKANQQDKPKQEEEEAVLAGIWGEDE